MKAAEMDEDRRESSKPYVIVDFREQAGAIKHALAEKHGFQVETSALKAGDYMLDGAMVVERKREDDFALSLVMGRLFKQAAMLASGELLPFLIIEKHPDSAWRSPVAPNALLGAQITLPLKFGIPVLHSSCQEETAFMLSDLIRQHRKPGSATVRTDYAPRRLRNRMVYMLSGFPGIGKTRGIEILRRFSTLRAAFAAGEQEWMEVRGIGRTMAGRIARLLDAEF